MVICYRKNVISYFPIHKIEQSSFFNTLLIFFQHDKWKPKSENRIVTEIWFDTHN